VRWSPFLLRERGNHFIFPTPRNINGKCRNNPDHVDDFDNDVIAIQEEHKAHLAGWAAASVNNSAMLVATALVQPVEPVLRNRIFTSSGFPLWLQWDHVHFVVS
jgi:hypothetical protein